MQEDQHTEWKESWRDDHLKWVCSFANAQGGVLEIGRNDQGRVIGLTDAEKLLEDIPNKIRDLLGILADVDLLDEEGRQYLRITVEPHPYPVSYKGEHHYRIGSTKQVLKGAALNRFLLNKIGKRWDAAPVPNVTLSDLDTNVLIHFRKRVAKSKRLGTEVIKEDDAGLIEKLHLMDGGYLKRAAILLFHPEPDRFVTGASIKVGFFENDSELRYHDEITGDLFTQADRTLDLLLTKYLKATISYKGIQRVETWPIPQDALREVLLNAIAHKDYASGVPIQIRVYDDRILFWNNGQLPENWTVERLTSKHSSQPYNPDIANAFFLAGMIEAWGRGIEKVMQACRNASLALPTLTYEKPGFWVEFRYPSMSQPSGKATQEATQETTQERISALLRQESTLTRKALAARVGIITAVVIVISFSAFLIFEHESSDPTVASAIEALSQELERKEQALADALQRADALQSEKANLEKAISAIPKQTEIPNAKARIEEALEEAAQGNTELAEAIFAEVEARKVAEGKAANKEAAETARHRGALAFLHDTDKALAAYRRATELDPDNADGWNQLGHLLRRTGALDEATVAYRKVESLGEATNDRGLLAVAYGNFGLIYETRGELDEAKAMYRKSLAINEKLGHKQGMAAVYGNLGLIYETRGELDEAEAMYRKSLALNEELGRKEGMANQYGNLGLVYKIRGELDEAEAMYRKSLAIDEKLGRKESMANAYGNLGILYQIRGELDEAEAMYRKALAINEELERKEGMAIQYGNQGNVYQIRGELDQAEAMYRKALAFNEELGRKEGMAIQYGNLGLVYKTRGDPEQAEAMYRRALGLFKDIGAAPRVEQVQGLLEGLRRGE